MNAFMGIEHKSEPHVYGVNWESPGDGIFYSIIFELILKPDFEIVCRIVEIFSIDCLVIHAIENREMQFNDWIKIILGVSETY